MRPERAHPGEHVTVQFLARVDFYTVAEVAARMRVSKMTVYPLLHGGGLPAARGGGGFRGSPRPGGGGRSACPGVPSRTTCATPASTPADDPGGGGAALGGRRYSGQPV